MLMAACSGTAFIVREKQTAASPSDVSEKPRYLHPNPLG
jgi:hypothetical protein